MDATTGFFGQFLSGMRRAGVRKMKIGVGGTMTVDGGAGLLQALGYIFIDRNGNDIPGTTDFITPRHLSEIYRIIPTNRLAPMFDQMTDLSVARDEGEFEIEALTDVHVPVVNQEPEQLSSLSFAPQKGLREGDLSLLREGLTTLRDSIETLYPFMDFSDAGAGGGLAMTLKLCNARLVNGAEYILDQQLKGVDSDMITHVYTGEGCFDLQSMEGKVTGTVIERFAQRGVPVTVVCGRISLPPSFVMPPNVNLVLLQDL